MALNFIMQTMVFRNKNLKKKFFTHFRLTKNVFAKFPKNRVWNIKNLQKCADYDPVDQNSNSDYKLANKYRYAKNFGSELAPFMPPLLRSICHQVSYIS